METYVVCIFSDAAQHMLLIVPEAICVFVHNAGVLYVCSSICVCVCVCVHVQ